MRSGTWPRAEEAHSVQRPEPTAQSTCPAVFVWGSTLTRLKRLAQRRILQPARPGRTSSALAVNAAHRVALLRMFLGF